MAVFPTPVLLIERLIELEKAGAEDTADKGLRITVALSVTNANVVGEEEGEIVMKVPIETWLLDSKVLLMIPLGTLEDNVDAAVDGTASRISDVRSTREALLVDEETVEETMSWMTEIVAVVCVRRSVVPVKSVISEDSVTAAESADCTVIGAVSGTNIVRFVAAVVRKSGARAVISLKNAALMLATLLLLSAVVTKIVLDPRSAESMLEEFTAANSFSTGALRDCVGVEVIGKDVGMTGVADTLVVGTLEPSNSSGVAR